MARETIVVGLLSLGLVLGGRVSAESTKAVEMKPAVIAQMTLDKIAAELGPSLTAVDRQRLARGLEQTARLWRAEDGDEGAFETFVKLQFIPVGPKLDTAFARTERLFEQLQGHMVEIGRELRSQTDLDLGEILPIDEIFAGYDPSAHVLDDLFANKLAFVILLNFPQTTLEERLRDGERWSRREWAEVRLTQGFSKRIPGEVNLELARAASETENYISNYNIWMHHVLVAKGRRLFPAKLRLLSHWNLRDQIKADYQTTRDGLARQRLIQRVMERIVDQSIPMVVIDNPAVDWNAFTNAVQPAAARDSDLPPAKAPVSDSSEGDRRFAMLLRAFRAARLVDPYSPLAPTLIARRFDENREIPEARVREMFEQVLSSPLVPKVAALIKKRLGRPLEPFDIWYPGFKPQPAKSQDELDALCQKTYPTAAAFEADIPNILVKLGFSAERARTIAANIAVDPARGSGHAMGAAMRQARARLRTRVEKDGMNYKGYNIALHEMGHNVEQTISLNDIDHTLLQGVPNTAFTEAIAFVFQARDLQVLGLAAPSAQDRGMEALNDFWATYEIAGVGLVDMAAWHWMYEHPNATPAELKAAVIAAAREVWNRYYAPVFGVRDVTLLAVYSHMINNFLYLPDYPLGHLIAAQIEGRVRESGSVGVEIERMARLGSITPDVWMKQATGAPVGPDALLREAERALTEIGRGPKTR